MDVWVGIYNLFNNYMFRKWKWGGWGSCQRFSEGRVLFFSLRKSSYTQTIGGEASKVAVTQRSIIKQRYFGLFVTATLEASPPVRVFIFYFFSCSCNLVYLNTLISFVLFLTRNKWSEERRFPIRKPLLNNWERVQ